MITQVYTYNTTNKKNYCGLKQNTKNKIWQDLGNMRKVLALFRMAACYASAVDF